MTSRVLCRERFDFLEYLPMITKGTIELDKTLLGVFVTVGIQSLTFVWLVGGLFQKVDNLAKEFSTLSVEFSNLRDGGSYLAKDAVKDVQRLQMTLREFSDKLTKIDERLKKHEIDTKSMQAQQH